MMDSFRNASKNTMFEQWLDATMQPPAAAGAPPPQQPGAVEPQEAGQQLPLNDLVQYLTDDEADTVKPAETENEAGPRSGTCEEIQYLVSAVNYIGHEAIYRAIHPCIQLCVKHQIRVSTRGLLLRKGYYPRGANGY